MMIIAVAMFVAAGGLLVLAGYVGAVLAYDELTGYRRIIEAQEARALAQRAAKYPWAPPVPCPICRRPAHAGGCPVPDAAPEPGVPQLHLLDAA